MHRLLCSIYDTFSPPADAAPGLRTRLPATAGKQHALLVAAISIAMTLCSAGSHPLGAQAPADPGNNSQAKPTSKPVAKQQWIALKDHWKQCEFGGDGEVKIKDGVVKLDFGQPITGVRWLGSFEGDKAVGSDSNDPKLLDAIKAAKKAPKLARDHYEIRWECRRNGGDDFLCAMTMPIGKNYISLVMGGWGGGITGISSIDGYDASDNETTTYKAYDNGTWYKARVRVDAAKITVWIDEIEMFDVPREGHTFDIRFEMEPCAPLGIANFECDSSIRNIQWRALTQAEKRAAARQQSEQ